MKHIGPLSEGVSCRKDTPGSCSVFSNSLARSEDMLNAGPVALLSCEIGEVSIGDS